MRAGQRLVHQKQYGSVRQLLKCVGESGTATKNDCDALILSCVSVADKGPADVSDTKVLIYKHIVITGVLVGHEAHLILVLL